MEIIAEINQEESRIRVEEGKTEIMVALTTILSVEQFNELIKKSKSGFLKLKVIENVE